ncbi:MAG: ATP-grasp domain-containing protein [Pirellulales bacterium]
MAEPDSGTLAIVGASARSAAQAALRAGIRVVTADLFADVDLVRHVPATRIAHYPADLLPWLREQQVTAWMYTGALENSPRLVDDMAQVAPLWGNAGSALRAVRSPSRIAACGLASNLLFPDIARSARGIPTDGSWLCKPLRGSNGAGIERWTGQPATSRQRVYWQRRVSGTPCAALYVASAGTSRLLGVTRQLIGESWTGAKPFQYAGTLGPWPTNPAQLDQITRIGQSLACVFALQGLFGVDLIIDNDRVWTIEVNPRYTAAAEVVERFSGLNPLVEHMVACGAKTQSTALPAAAGQFYGKAILYATRDAGVTEEFFGWAIRQSGPTLDSILGDIPPSGTQVRADHPVLTVLAGGGSLAMVEAELKARVDKVSLALNREWRGEE